MDKLSTCLQIATMYSLPFDFSGSANKTSFAQLCTENYLLP